MTPYARIYFPLILLLFHLPYGAAQYDNIVSSDTIEFQLRAEVYDDNFSSLVQIRGDTTLGSEIYKRTYYKSYEYPFKLVGFFREDSTNGKAWFKNINDTEYLIYDISLDIGDQFAVQLEYSCEGYLETIANVIDVAEEDERKVITFDINILGGEGLCEPLRFIEGVGPSASIFFQNPILDAEDAGFAYLVCRKNPIGLDDYINTTNALCNVSNLGTIPKLEANVHFRVNGNYLVVESDLPAFPDWDVVVYDMMGRIVAIDKSGDSNIKVIEVYNSQPCIYVLALFDKDHVIYTFRLFKN